MILTERLQESGVNLGQIVGFIVGYYDECESWHSLRAGIAHVCTELPEGAELPEEAQDYDPKHDLALISIEADEHYLCILRLHEGGKLYKLNYGELLIDNPNGGIQIGQSEDFMQSVCEIMCALAAPQ